ncbi:unnamed protein product [Brachionus calyciflorus]|uniref:KAP NTPase domain-containing protein n=1 Tax=Brachionus calyciflorus TaxID=104777 RepID=A0A813UEK0_9BILA|nr:unnamed protein product [Brachionus calyciflorus]
MENIQADLFLQPEINIETNQNTIHKKQTLSLPNSNPLSNLFHPLHHLHLHHKQNHHDLIEYSPEALLQYTKEGNYELVKEVIDHFKFLNHSTSDSNFFKHQGISSNSNTITSGNASKAYETITGHSKNKLKIDLEVHDNSKQTPLIIACRINSYDIASLLIDNGAKVNSKDMDSWTPLLNASKNGNLKLVSLLIEKKAGIDDKDCGGFTPLMWACYKNHLDVVKYLLKHNANPNAQCKNQICCLSWASGRGHYDVVVELLNRSNIKVDLQDQNSSTAVLWAARKGNLEILKALVERGANPDLSGMNNMNPLIISCKNGHVNVALYLAKLTNINVNHVDKDGASALGISAKAGYRDVVLSLLEKGAYVNTVNKKGDSIFITAVKGGHREIVEALLARHVEVDAIGSQGKTAIHYAIEKGNLEIIKLILAYKPDLEIVGNDGDTPLLLAVKKKNPSMVNELLNAGSKVSPTDKNGDNALHIALRNKSREITELILSNPKNSKYLYKPNKEGDTPHKIDASNPKSILTQIFGARQLNMTEDSILGYDLYSSALAEILSEPSLHTPLTVGLYAKWGSGKSFLLSQLKSEMKSFAKLTHVVNLKLNFFLISTIIFMSLLLTTPFIFWNWQYGLGLLGTVLLISFFVIIISKYFYEKRESEWAERLCEKVSTHLTRFKLLLRILFLNPIKYKNENIEHKNLRFIFTEYGKISTIGGENALALMISALNTKMEKQLGVVNTRLCRVFYNKSHSHSKYRRFCCIPTFFLVIIVSLLLIGLAIFFRVKGFNLKNFNKEDEGFVITVVFMVLISIIGSSLTWSKILWSLIRSPSSKIMSAVNSKDKLKHPDANKMESYIFKLKREVDLIAHTVRTIDAFSHSCTRLVIIIDGLDSCEQTKVLQILEIVHVLFTREGDPFVSILAVDPHVLIKGIEGNLIAAFRNGNVNGHDYLRTIIHLPIYLQVDLSKAKALAKIPNKFIKRQSTIGSSQEIISKIGAEVTYGKKNKKNRKRNSSKPMSAIDLTDQLIKSEYFSDVNPRNLRRLINIIALTGRLLRAYHIEFNWRVLASWIYLNEQWPYRCSWIVMYYDDHEDEFTEETTLNEVYEQVKNQIPSNNEPLLELDRNSRKFEQFIQNCEPKLTCTILKKILPCTCNLDPYLIKQIKESIDARDEKINTLPNSNYLNMDSFNVFNNSNTNQFGYGQQFPSNRLHLPSPNLNPVPLYVTTNEPSNSNERKERDWDKSNLIGLSTPNDENSYSQIDMTKILSEMNVTDVCDAIMNNIEFLSQDFKDVYVHTIKEKNINGRVLVSCDLELLKNELNMSFGDWYLFKDWLLYKKANNQKRFNTKIENRPKNFQVKTPSQTKIVSSENTGSHRKVEFFVTPVSENEVVKIQSPKSDISDQPIKPILVRQQSSSSKSTHSKIKHQETELTILSMDDEIKDTVLEEQTPLVIRNNENGLHLDTTETNTVAKIGKKIFKSIDNLFHKSEHSGSRTVSISHDENETVLNEDDENNLDENDDSDSSSLSEQEVIQENSEKSKENSKLKQGKRESIKMENLKKSFIKVKNQFLSSGENQTSSSSKSDLVNLKSSPNANSSNTSLTGNSISPTGNRSRKESSSKNLNTNEETKTKTYFIFEDEDELIT